MSCLKTDSVPLWKEITLFYEYSWKRKKNGNIKRVHTCEWMISCIVFVNLPLVFSEYLQSLLVFHYVVLLVVLHRIIVFLFRLHFFLLVIKSYKKMQLSNLKKTLCNNLRTCCVKKNKAKTPTCAIQTLNWTSSAKNWNDSYLFWRHWGLWKWNLDSARKQWDKNSSYRVQKQGRLKLRTAEPTGARDSSCLVEKGEAKVERDDRARGSRSASRSPFKGNLISRSWRHFYRTKQEQNNSSHFGRGESYEYLKMNLQKLQNCLFKEKKKTKTILKCCSQFILFIWLVLVCGKKKMLLNQIYPN